MDVHANHPALKNWSSLSVMIRFKPQTIKLILTRENWSTEISCNTNWPARLDSNQHYDSLEDCCLSLRLRTDKEKPHRKYYVLVDEAVLYGAGEEARTLDIFLGKEVLYQLSYTRIVWSGVRESNSRL